MPTTTRDLDQSGLAICSYSFAIADVVFHTLAKLPNLADVHEKSYP